MNIQKRAGLGWISVVFGLVFLMTGTEVLAASTVTFEQSVHFFTPSGDDVLVEVGDYEVEVAEEWLRLIPKGGERSDAILLNAREMPSKEVEQAKFYFHLQNVDTLQVFLVPEGEDTQELVLLLPTEQGVVASGSVSGVRSRGMFSLSQVHENFAKCIGGALRGPEARFISLYGQSWHCKPAQFIWVHHPQFKSLALQAILSDFAWSVISQEMKDDLFNQLFQDLNLLSASENTHVMIGQLSRHKKWETDDQAFYHYALRRLSADEIVVENARVTFKPGGIFATPFIGKLLELGIKYGVGTMTGIPFSGDLSLKIIKEIEGQDNAGAEANANRIATTIALSAMPVLKPAASEILPAVVFPLY